MGFSEVKECGKLVTRTCHVLEELGMLAFRDALKHCGLVTDGGTGGCQDGWDVQLEKWC